LSFFLVAEPKGPCLFFCHSLWESAVYSLCRRYSFPAIDLPPPHPLPSDPCSPTQPTAAFSPSTLDGPPAARAFVRSTFYVIHSGNLAAAFTFGREDVIADIFRNLVRDLNASTSGELSKFVWYLERHIEVDSEDHGPLSLRMVADLCANDDTRWEQATLAAESALEARLALWEGILAEIQST
jgi:hypothetical protein